MLRALGPVRGRRWEGGGGRWEEVGGGRWEEGGGGRWVAPNRTAPTDSDTSSKETAGNANRTEANRNTHGNNDYIGPLKLAYSAPRLRNSALVTQGIAAPEGEQHIIPTHEVRHLCGL